MITRNPNCNLTSSFELQTQIWLALFLKSLYKTTSIIVKLFLSFLIYLHYYCPNWNFGVFSKNKKIKKLKFRCYSVLLKFQWPNSSMMQLIILPSRSLSSYWKSIPVSETPLRSLAVKFLLHECGFTQATQSKNPNC